jgi:glycosyltransferase involved in cell wall biosynthesis
VAHGGETLKYLAVLPRRRRLVFFAIGTVGAKVHRWPHRLLYTVLCRRAHLVVGVSREVVEECADLLGVPRPKLVVAPNGRDPDRYHPAPRTGGTPVLLFVGHLTVHKRPDLFVEAVDRLRRRGIDLSAAIVGGGPMEAALRAPAGAAGVELLGERNDVPELLGAADVLVFTSSGESEGMPGVLIEAGLSGVPVVATDVAGVADVVDPGRTGLIVPPGDVDAVVEAVAALLADPARRLEFGRAARERCVERFSIEAGAAVWRRCIDDLANGGR